MRASINQTEGDLKALKVTLQAQSTPSTRSVLPIYDDMAQAMVLLQSFETTLERSLVSLLSSVRSVVPGDFIPESHPRSVR